MIIQTKIEISAPPMKVWRALCDFGSYPRWHPFHEMLGVAALGEKVTIKIGPIVENRRRVPATISAFEPGRRLSFRSGRTFFSKATETFSLEPGRHGTVLHHSAEMTGIAVLLSGGKRFEPRLLAVYQKTDRALERYVTSYNPGKAPSRTRHKTRS